MGPNEDSLCFNQSTLALTYCEVSKSLSLYTLLNLILYRIHLWDSKARDVSCPQKCRIGFGRDICCVLKKLKLWITETEKIQLKFVGGETESDLSGRIIDFQSEDEIRQNFSFMPKTEWGAQQQKIWNVKCCLLTVVHFRVHKFYWHMLLQWTTRTIVCSSRMKSHADFHSET